MNFNNTEINIDIQNMNYVNTEINIDIHFNFNSQPCVYRKRLMQFVQSTHMWYWSDKLTTDVEEKNYN